MMEFKITQKSKTLTTVLMGVGVLFTAIGIGLNSGDENIVQRIMANGLINGFYFFALGIGALFFLALQYATETGWYASIKRVIEAVAGFLPFGMGILAAVLLIITFCT